jgi:hypothetical protein
VDRDTLETEPVVFLIIKYQGTTQIYLIIDDEFYKMSKVYERYDWETGTKIFQYEAEDGSVMTVVVQSYYPERIVSISADFKNYLINFEPIHKHLLRPTVGEVKPLRKISRVKEKIGIDMEEVLEKSAKPIAEWVS